MLNGSMMIEEIKNNSGYALKFPNGTLIQFGKSLITVPVKNTWGSLASSGNVEPNIIFAMPFSEVYSCNVTAQYQSYSCFIGDVDYSNNGINKIQLFRGNAGDGVRIYINYIAIGRWK